MTLKTAMTRNNEDIENEKSDSSSDDSDNDETTHESTSSGEESRPDEEGSTDGQEEEDDEEMEEDDDGGEKEEEEGGGGGGDHTGDHEKLPEPLVQRTSSVEIIREKLPTQKQSKKEKKKMDKLKQICERKLWLDGRYYQVNYEKSIKKKEGGVVATCQICGSEYSGKLHVSSNFVTHLERRHQEEYADYQKYKAKKADSTRKTIKRTTCKFSQKQFNKDLTNFFATGCASLRIVEEEKFQQIFHSMQVKERGKSLKIISRRELSRRIKKRFERMVVHIREMIAGIKYFCTTADIWSSGARRAIGMTLHWIDPITFDHKSMAIACRRFTGTHNYTRIASMIEAIHKEFGLNSENVVATVTDNASNFKKAFATFGVVLDDQCYEENPEQVPAQSTIYLDEDDNEDISEEWRFENLDEEQEPHLSLQLYCADHTLGLIATTDAEKAVKKVPKLLKTHEKALGNVGKLWKLMGSPKNREKLTKIVGHALRRPVKTRWNSLHKSLLQLLSIQEKIQEVIRKMKIVDPPDSSDFEYITMFTTCMEPIASAISRLEGDKKVYYGELLPTLITTRRKLQQMLNSTGFTLCHPLLRGLLSSMERRFADIFNVQNSGELAAVAAFSYPKFKDEWLKSFSREKKEEILRLIKRKAREMMRNETLNPSEQPLKRQLSDFYDFGEPSNPEEDRRTHDTHIDVEVDIMKYLDDSRTDVTMLDSYPILKELFFKYNTPLPSSAPVERLFSSATLMTWPKFNRLTPKFFEMRVLGIANADKIEL